MKPHKAYEPRKKSCRMSNAAAIVFAAATIGLWLLRERLDMEYSRLIMLAGLSVILGLLCYESEKRNRSNYEYACRLKEQREKIKADDFSDCGIFFKNK